MFSTTATIPTPTVALAAVLTGAPCTFVYVDRDGVRSIRHATFNSIERCQNGSRVVRAYDHDRLAPRTFCLNGILGIVDQGQTISLTVD